MFFFSEEVLVSGTFINFTHNVLAKKKAYKIMCAYAL